MPSFTFTVTLYSYPLMDGHTLNVQKLIFLKPDFIYFPFLSNLLYVVLLIFVLHGSTSPPPPPHLSEGRGGGLPVVFSFSLHNGFFLKVSKVL